MKILLIFETVEGQTRKTVEFIKDHLNEVGHFVPVFDTSDHLGKVSFGGIDKVILAAPIHEWRHPKGFEVFVSASLAGITQRSTLMLSVSLKAAFWEGREEDVDYLTEMKMRTGFWPDKELLVAGAVRTRSYGNFESQVVCNVVLANWDVDLVDGVREGTDWYALESELATFLDPVSPGSM